MSNLFNNPDDLVDVVRQILSGKPLEEKKKEEELAPVNKQAVKKKFDDRKDKDIDNDGDVDSTDKYLHKRRKAISKSLNEKEPKKKINASHCEEVELGEEFKKGDKVIVKVGKSSDRELQQLSKKFGNTISGVVMGQTGKIVMVKTDKGQINPSVKDVMKEEVELDENYRKAALKGIGAETANSIKVGTGVDYYSPKDGSKHMGKITRMDKNGYEVKDEKTGKTFKFKYYSKDAMKEEKRNCGCEQDPCITYGDQTVKEAELDEQLAKIKGGSPADAGRRAAVEDDIARAKKAGDKKLVKKLEEASDEDGDGEKKTAAQKADMDGDGEKDTGEKKKKKKKDEKGEKEDEAKPDKVNTEPEMDNVKTMMSEREMTDKEKAKLDKLKKKYEGGEMHKSMKDQYGDKADEVFYGKLTKMAMGEEVDFNNHVEYLEEKQIDALKKKAEKTGIPYGILKQVYNRGMAAWRTGHRPGTTPQQWAFARVNSFATKSKGTWGGADKDLAAKARGSTKKEEVELDEGQKPYVSSDSDGKNVMSASGKVVKSFKDMESANKYLRKNYNKLAKEEVELDEDKKELAKISKELAGASKMHKGQSDRIKKMLDKGDMKEAKDGEEKDTNLIMQLRKAVSLRGNTVNFANGPEKVPANVANAFLMKYAKMKRPAEKDMMTKSGGKSLNHLKLAIKGKFEKPSSPLDLPKMKSEK